MNKNYIHIIDSVKITSKLIVHCFSVKPNIAKFEEEKKRNHVVFYLALPPTIESVPAPMCSTTSMCNYCLQ